MPELTQSRLKELLRYDTEMGLFVRLVRTSPNTKIGDVAGSPNNHGYILIRIEGKLHSAHRLAFLYMTGMWPSHEVDHINMVKGDNRWANLREATRSQNMANRKRWTSALPRGVRWAGYGGYQAQINVAGKKVYLGCFATPEEAHAEWAKAANDNFGEFARTA